MTQIPNDLVEQAVETVTALSRATPTTLERLMRVHYWMAVELLEHLEKIDVVGPVIGKHGERRTIRAKAAS